MMFGIGYAKDSLDLRLIGLRYLLGGLVSLANVIVFIILGQTLSDILAGLQAIFPTIAGGLVVLVPLFFAWIGIVVLGTERFVRWVASWLEKSIPEILKEARVSLDTWHKLPIHRLTIKPSWSVGVVMYLMILIIAAWRGQLDGRAFYDALYVAAFLIVTEAIMLWRLRWD